MLVLPLLVVVIVVGIGVGVARAHGRRVGWHNALRRVALGFALACTVFIGLFIAGAALSDPGGFAGVGLVATWLLPLVGLSLLAWRRPMPGATLLLVIGVVPALLAFAATGDGGAGTLVTLAGSPAVLTGMLFLVAEILPRAHPELRGPVRVE